MPPEIIYRSDKHKFSVYHLNDIPVDTPISGAAEPEFWTSGRWADCLARWGVEWLEGRARSVFGRDTLRLCAAVLDKHAGPILAKSRPEPLGAPVAVHDADLQSWTVTRKSTPVEVPALDLLAEQTKRLGAQHGEAAYDRVPHDSDAWSAHLRALVQSSEARDRANAPSVCWTPGDEDDFLKPATAEEVARIPPLKP